MKWNYLMFHTMASEVAIEDLKENYRQKGAFMKHHRLDQYPIPKDKTPHYINEPWLADRSLLMYSQNRESEV